MLTLTPDPQRDPLSQIREWILSGASEHDVRQAIAAHYPQADGEALILAVIRDIEKAATSSPSLLIGLALEMTKDLYRRMVEIGDFAGALRASKQVLALAKLMQPAKPADTDDGESDIISLLDVG